MGFFRVLGAIVLAALAIGLAGAIFQTGYLAGVAADGGAAPVVVGNGYGYGWGGGWGFGGGLFHILGFLFFLFLFFAILRAVFGGGRGWGRGGWGPGGYRHDGSHRFGPWEQRAREAHDEWHRSQGSGGSGGGSGTTGPSGGTNPNEPPSGGAA